MNSGEIGTWVGNLITLISLVLFIFVEREKLFPGKKGKTPTSPNPDNAAFDNLRSLIYPRILIGLIVGFALNRLFTWVFSEYGNYGGLFNNLPWPLTVFKVLVSVICAVLLGLLFQFIYLRFVVNIKAFFYHWFERAFIAFVLLSSIVETYGFDFDIYGKALVRGLSTYASMLITVFLITVISLPMSPVEIIALTGKKLTATLIRKNPS